MVDSFRRRFQEWAEGDPPMGEQLHSTVYEHYRVGLYVTGIFLDVRRKYRKVSIVGLVLAEVVMALYSWMSVVTAGKLRDDFPAASLCWNFCIMMTIGMVFTISLNFKRKEIIELIRCMSFEFVKLNDDEIDEETTTKIAKIKRKGMIFLALVPTLLLIGGVVAVLGPVIDSFVGMSPNSTYVNGVYTRIPFPLWYPFEVTSEILHYVVLLSEVGAASIVVSTYSGLVMFLVITLQNVSIQLVILKMRIRKIHFTAYKLHMEKGGPKLRESEMFADHGYLKCYIECLNRCAAHHVSILKGFKHLNNSIGLFLDIAIMFSAVLIAMALLALVVGRKPSIFCTGLVSLTVEVINTTIVIWSSVQVMDLAESLRADLYDTHWQKMDKRANRTLLIILGRCNHPLRITSFIHHTSFDWETYGKIMNAAYSYLNFIIAMQ